MVRYVTAHLLSRLEFLYWRKNTLKQVFENTESTSRQYRQTSASSSLIKIWAIREPQQLTGWGSSGLSLMRESDTWGWSWSWKSPFLRATPAEGISSL